VLVSKWKHSAPTPVQAGLAADGPELPLGNTRLKAVALL
jgi:hypothetical protein